MWYKKLRNILLISSFILIVLISVLGINIYLNRNDDKNDLINISSLSKEFMDDYFEEISEIKEESKENILIVASKKKLKNTYGATNVIEAPNHQYVLQYDSKENKEKALSKFKEDDSSVDVSENIVREISDDTVLVSSYNSWGVEAMGIDTLLEKISTRELNNVVVAIIDTGLDVDLFNQNYPERLAGQYNVLTSSEEMTDEVGHGTHIAGTIAESTSNNVKILPIKISKTNYMYASDIIAGINYATYTKKTDVMNMSFGGYGYSILEYTAIEAATQNNIVSVAAAGNDNVSDASYPSAFDNTISIAAVNSNKGKADFSNYGNYIMFASPGVDIVSINGTKSGTSMATPHAASAVALLKSLNKNITFDDSVTILRRYSDDLGDISWDKYYGYGFINFEEAEICDKSDCDEFNIFKKSNRDNLEVTMDSYEIIPATTTYNYGTINNILNTSVHIKYNNNGNTDFRRYKLYDFPDLEISGYDPYLIGMEYQTVNVKFTTPLGEVIDDSFKIRHTADKESVWEYNILSDNNIELTNFKDENFTGNSLYIPSKIGNFTVVATADLEQSLFEDTINSLLNIKNLYLPYSITKIGKNAFYYYDSYKDVGNNLLYVKSDAESIQIMDNAFGQSKSLVAFDANISYVGDYSFQGTKELMNIKLDNLTYIGKSAFESGLKKVSITIPKNITTIGENAFYESGLKEIIFMNNLEKISDYMFFNNSYLEKVILSENLKEIGNYAFSECRKLKSISLPESLTTIGESAFKNALDKVSLIIPKNVTTIGERAFMNEYGDLGLKEITFMNNLDKIPDDMLFNNDSLEEVILPESLKEIGEYAFYGCEKLKTINLPENLTIINRYAFLDCKNLLDVYFDKNVITINPDAFKNIPSNANFYVYSNTVPKTFAQTNNINYIQIDPDSINVTGFKEKYSAFDKVDLDNISIELIYNEKIPRTELIDKNIEIEYASNIDGFRYGDTSFKIITYNKFNHKIEKNVEIEVVKATPNYEVPTNLKADIGQELSEISLPDGFEWMDENILIENSGNQTFKAKYIPKDTTNYKIIEDIDINVKIEVENKKTIIKPQFEIEDKIYDGTNIIETNSIVVHGLEKEDYTIISAESDSENSGKRTAKIILKLSDEKFANYSFDNGSQSKEFNPTFIILPKKLTKPTLTDKTYTYNGNEQTVELNRFDKNTMNITGNKRTNAGEQDVRISLRNSNYVWNDNKSSDVVLKFKINKAPLQIEYSSSDNIIKYDGNNHGINLNIESPSNVVVKYMDEDGNYSLNEMPKYSEIGEYKIKFRIYIDDNYTDIIGENTLKIINNTIINNTKDYEGVYDGKEHTIKIDVNVSDYKIKYSINNTNYDLNELPKFKDVGDYTIHYKIISENYDDFVGTNKVKIFGIKAFDSSLLVKDNILILKNNSFSNLTNKIKVCANKTIYNHFDRNSSLVNSDMIKTGDVIDIIINDIKNYAYNISISGDVNADGKITSADYVKIRKYIMQIEEISNNIYFYAADINNDEKITSKDYVKIRKYIMNGESL